jgi:hypothetical protein
MTRESLSLNRTAQDDSNDVGSKAELLLSAADQHAIHSLAQELGAPLDKVAQLYRDELARLRPGARVAMFLPLVVSRLVRRRSAELTECRGR